MTDKQYTPEPWALNRHGAIIGGPIIEYTNGGAQSQIAMVIGADWMKEGETLANARRIVACVNACAHVSTEALEAASPGQMKSSLDRMHEEIERLEQQRDKLMSFVEEYIEAWNDGMAGDSYLLRNAKELIAAVKGETP